MNMATLNSRHLLLAGALLLTLAAAWFAPPPEDAADIAAPAAVAERGRGGPAQRAANGQGGEVASQVLNQTTPQTPGGQPSASPEATAAERRQALATLDVGVIGARGLGVGAGDLFSNRSWEPPPPPAPPEPPPPPPEPPPPPQAPPLPFKHLGKLHEKGAAKALHYLMDGDQMLVVTIGELIGTEYRLVGEDGGYLQFVYLPLNIKQSLPISGAP